MTKLNWFYGNMTAGKLTCPSFIDALRGFDGPVMLTVQRLKGGRSSQANRYYWGVVVELIFKALKEGGIEITREGTHELLKMRFLTTDLRLGVEGEVVTMMRSTTELAQDEFGAYIEHCVQFAAEYLNVVIPGPGEQIEMNVEA